MQDLEHKEYSILCDCKNVVHYVQGNYQLPEKYAEDVYRIQQKITQLGYEGIQVDVHWIPGHTDHKWNDLADTLAKEAAKLPPQPAKHQSSLAEPPPPQHHPEMGAHSALHPSPRKGRPTG